MPHAAPDPLARTGAAAPASLFDMPATPLSARVAPRPPYGGAPPARRTDTSRAAAAQQRAKAPSIRVQILDFVRSRPDGVTAEEAAAPLAGIRGLPADNTACRHSAGARLTELKLAGQVRDSG